MSYSQRFLSYHRYFNDLSEDILANTLCLPFMLLLMSWSSICDSISDAISVDNRLERTLFKAGKFILLIPLMILKGILSLTTNPFLATLLAFSTYNVPCYQFTLAKVVRKFLLRIKRLCENLLPLVLLIKHFRSIVIALSVFAVVLFMIPSQYLNPTKIKDLTGKVLDFCYYIYEFYMFSWIFLLAVPSFQFLFVPVSLLALPLWVVGAYQSFGLLLSQAVNKVIVNMQSVLRKMGKNPFKNDQDISLTPIKELPTEILFVSNSNHVFNLNDLEQNLAYRGLENFYDRNARFDEDDLLRIERHVSIDKFPQLKQYILTHKNEHGPQRQISQTSLMALMRFAKKLIQPQVESASDPLADNMIQAKQEFEQYLQTLTPVEKNAIETLNLLGGIDSSYQLNRYIESVFKGNYCKKDASRRIEQIVDRINQVGEEAAVVYHPFWRRETP